MTSRGITARVLAIVAAALALTLPIAGSAAAHAGGSAKASPHPGCSSLLSLTDLTAASGISAVERTRTESWKQENDEIWTRGLTGGPGSVAGSACFYGTSTPGTSYTQHTFFQNDVLLGYVVTGYDQSAQEFKRYLAFRKANGGSEAPSLWVPSSAINGHGTVSKATLGGGSQSFVIDFDLVASGEAEPTSFPQFPTHFYVVDALSKRGNVLQVAIYGASQAATEGLARKVLQNPKF